MKRVLITAGLLHGTLFAHSMTVPQTPERSHLNYGIYGDVMYRDRDLYPNGVEGSAGFENHGVADAVELNHIGAYLYGDYEGWLYGADINRHIDAPATFDGLVEKLYAGYGSDTMQLRAGRDSDPVSFVRSQPWGYGFATMPLGVDSFFDGTYFGDGLFADYDEGNWQLSADLMQDRYTQTLRATLRLGWQLSHHVTLDTYVQWRDTSEVRSDYSTSRHTHTHGSGCDNLSSFERCIKRSNTVAGLGAQGTFDAFSFLGEYMFLQGEGDVYSNRYKVESDVTLQTLYVQGIYTLKQLQLGLRSEGFVFSNRYDGAGATDVAELMRSGEDDEVQYLNTFLMSWRPCNGFAWMVQAENSQDGWAWRSALSFTYSGSKGY